MMLRYYPGRDSGNTTRESLVVMSGFSDPARVVAS
jgi:hypothetical protein